MYYGLSDHIYIAQFRNEVIMLDTINDKYIICSPEFSHVLTEIFKLKSVHFSSIPQNLEKTIIQTLIDNNVIKERKNPYPFYIDHKLNTRGVSNIDWVLPLENKKWGLNLHVLWALVTLVKVNFYIKFKGFYAAIKLIRKSRRNPVNYSIPDAQELRDLAHTVNKACLIYPSRTKCLEWAMTYVLLSLERKWRCNLEIGVQNYPFFAHAWVECNGKVITDSQELRKGLAIILKEPFKRLKK